MYSERSQLFDLNAFDEILKYMNEMSNKFVAEECLWRALFLYEKFEYRLGKIIKLRLDYDLTLVEKEEEQDTQGEEYTSECTDEELQILLALLEKN